MRTVIALWHGIDILCRSVCSCSVNYHVGFNGFVLPQLSIIALACRDGEQEK